MQNSSEFQYIALDTIHESATNPRRTFDDGLFPFVRLKSHTGDQ